VSYDGEAVDELTHALQAFGQAVAAGADDELVIAAALHDIGRAPAVRQRFGRIPHEQAGAAFVREMLPERVAWLVGAHVAAKRYLVATDSAYAGTLSPASVASLKLQGGPMSGDEVVRFEREPWHTQALALRRWDEGAKDPHAATPTLDELRPYLVRLGL
ncbi:MAG: HD domain-containing protein, partial [Chloroflexi bacterium]|nr:HD domain-containing protein [Chloroflexota bacterium]